MWPTWRKPEIPGYAKWMKNVGLERSEKPTFSLGPEGEVPAEAVEGLGASPAAPPGAHHGVVAPAGRSACWMRASCQRACHFRVMTSRSQSAMVQARDLHESLKGGGAAGTAHP